MQALFIRLYNFKYNVTIRKSLNLITNKKKYKKGTF